MRIKKHREPETTQSQELGMIVLHTLILKLSEVKVSLLMSDLREKCVHILYSEFMQHHSLEISTATPANGNHSLKPVRPSFIFRTQIKIFLMKSESSLTLHRHQGSYHDQGTERYQEEHRQNSPCDISGSTAIL